MQTSPIVPANNYYHIWHMVRQLPRWEQVRLLSALDSAIQQPPDRPKAPRITELKGLGQSIWQKVVVPKYLETLRTT